MKWLLIILLALTLGDLFFALALKMTFIRSMIMRVTEEYLRKQINHYVWHAKMMAASHQFLVAFFMLLVVLAALLIIAKFAEELKIAISRIERRFTNDDQILFGKGKLKAGLIPFLLVMPIVIALSFVYLNSVRGPYYLAYNSDPEYAYLLNSLKLSEFKQPSHIDHPGTTLQAIGAIEIRLANIGKSAEKTRQAVLLQPEHYILALNTTLLVLLVALTATLGILVLQFSGALWPAVLLQLWLIYSPTVFVELSRFRPDSLLLCISLVFAMLMVSTLKYSIEKHAMKYLVAFCIICGFGMATKITFFPILLIPVCILPRLVNKARFLLGTVASFVLFTAPIITRYGDMFRWIKSLIVHSGYYGSGASNIIDVKSFTNGISSILLSEALFSIVLLASLLFILICVVVAGYRKYFYCSLQLRVLTSIVIAELLQVIVVSKHFASHYLIPGIMLTGLAMLYLGLNAKRMLNLRLSESILAFGGVCLLFVSLAYKRDAFQKLGLDLNEMRQEALQIDRVVDAKYGDYAKIYYYRCSSPKYALGFGNDFSGGEYSDDLDRLFPKNYMYNIWTKEYKDFRGGVGTKQIFDVNSKVIFQGTPFDKNYRENPEYKPDLQLKDVYDGANETIYIARPPNP